EIKPYKTLNVDAARPLPLVTGLVGQASQQDQIRSVFLLHPPLEQPAFARANRVIRHFGAADCHTIHRKTLRESLFRQATHPPRALRRAASRIRCHTARGPPADRPVGGSPAPSAATHGTTRGSPAPATGTPASIGPHPYDAGRPPANLQGGPLRR